MKKSLILSLLVPIYSLGGCSSYQISGYQVDKQDTEQFSNSFRQVAKRYDSNKDSKIDEEEAKTAVKDLEKIIKLFDEINDLTKIVKSNK